MARKKNKKNPPAEVSDVPVAAESAATSETPATDVAAMDESVADTPPGAKSAGRPAKKKSKKAAAPKAAPKEEKPKAPQADTPEIKEDSETPRKMRALDAAAKVLEESGQPMNCQEMIQAMAAKGYWSSPAGKTPAATLYSAIMREAKIKGNQARFQKTTRGHFVYQSPQAS